VDITALGILYTFLDYSYIPLFWPVVYVLQSICTCKNYSIIHIQVATSPHSWHQVLLRAMTN